ncbi:MAG: ROK family protein [Bacteroidaceae bacterium]|nr:ROK family protein [Bacteroidaceae bacterium]
MYKRDNRIVATLDAGGTSFVFGAMKAGEFIIDPVSVPAQSHDLDLCLQNMVNGFRQVFDKLEEKPVAISFAFPGPADYPNGIIGGYLPNFPSFRDGVALGAFLESKFGVPVFINNDGDLFAYGEALCGMLPEINSRLKELGSTKQYKNLIGYTLGTGFGIGVVIDNNLNRGDNSCVETFCLRHRDMPDVIVEDGVAIRAVCRVYGEQSGNPDHGLTPKDICEIADGTREGNQAAAKEAFASLGRVAGAAISTAVTIIDGLVVIGGGVSAASRWIMPALLDEMRSKLRTLGGDEVNLVQMKVYDLENADEFALFAKGETKKVKVYGEERYVDYDCQKRVGIAISKLGASKAVSVGAYAFALSELDKKQA